MYHACAVTLHTLLFFLFSKYLFRMYSRHGLCSSGAHRTLEETGIEQSDS